MEMYGESASFVRVCMYMYTLQGTNIRYHVPPNMKLGRNHGRKNAKLGGDTVDGRNPAPVDMQNRP